MGKNKLIHILYMVLVVCLGACCKGKKDSVTIYKQESEKDWLVDNNNLSCVFKEISSSVFDTIVYDATTNKFECQNENNGSKLFPCDRSKCYEAFILQELNIQPKKMQYYVYEVDIKYNACGISVVGAPSVFAVNNRAGGVLQKTIDGTTISGYVYQVKIVNSQNLLSIFVVPNKGPMQYQYTDKSGKEVTWERIN